jgi:hypothetical protein
MLEKAVSLCFGRFDRDGSGYIEKSEVLGVLETVCKALHLPAMPPATLVDATFGRVQGRAEGGAVPTRNVAASPKHHARRPAFASVHCTARAPPTRGGPRAWSNCRSNLLPR